MSSGEPGLFLSVGTAGMLLLALAFDRLIGYPDRLSARIGHPVTWAGALIDRLDARLNHLAAKARVRRRQGILTVAIVLVAVLAVTVPLALLLDAIPHGWIVEALLASTLIAQRSLRTAVAGAESALDLGLDPGRDAVRHIVGRDPETLDRTGLARASIESLAENFSDGVVAPAFYLLLFGLPGIAVYKAVNTLDSMIGHTSQRYLAFGWAAAKLDDVLNWVPARLTGLIIAAAAGLEHGASGRAAARTMWRDARKHLSPNAGWPEAAMAGALGLKLGGPRSYLGRAVDLAWMGEGREAATTADIARALDVFAWGKELVLALAAAAFVIVAMVSG